MRHGMAQMPFLNSVMDGARVPSTLRSREVILPGKLALNGAVQATAPRLPVIKLNWTKQFSARESCYAFYVGLKSNISASRPSIHWRASLVSSAKKGGPIGGIYG
jgi:hypothetical protein